MVTSWKTTLAGLFGGLMILFGSRLSGNTTAPAVTFGNVAQAAAIAALGILAKDETKPQ